MGGVGAQAVIGLAVWLLLAAPGLLLVGGQLWHEHQVRRGRRAP